MKRELVIGGLVVAWGILTACSASPSSGGADTRPLGRDGDASSADGSRADGSSAEGSSAEGSRADGATVDASETGSTCPSCPLGCQGGKCLTLTPSNLPADICDTPGTKDFTGGDLPQECDAVIPQNGGPDICLFKFANVSGDIGSSRAEVVAVVATNSMQLGSYRVPRAERAFGTSHGETGSPYCGGGGGGFGTQGGSPGGAPYGSEAASPLLPGSWGGIAMSVGGSGGENSPGGPAASAVQFVSCGTLRIVGSIVADGEEGYRGGTPGARGAGGGGSGGTILIEAASVSADASSALRANGGNGGSGLGFIGGQGGKANAPPGPATCGEDTPGTFPPYTTGGGGGGAAGRIRINVAGGTQPELLGSVSPVPSIGAVATH